MRDDIRDSCIRDIGCIACRIRGYAGTPCEKHHLLTTARHGTGKRRGGHATIGLCPWHHRGRSAVGSDSGRFRAMCGPSYADEARAFRAEFGPDDVLLAIQDELIAQLMEKAV